VGDDRRWQLLEDSRSPLLDAFGEHGVARIEFVGAFLELNMVGVWLGTSTDVERDAVDMPHAVQIVRSVLLAVGFTIQELQDLAVIAQSQETVDREYAGSWFYAMR
jgi:hypothetical protein